MESNGGNALMKKQMTKIKMNLAKTWSKLKRKPKTDDPTRFKNDIEFVDYILNVAWDRSGGTETIINIKKQKPEVTKLVDNVVFVNKGLLLCKRRNVLGTLSIDKTNGKIVKLFAFI